MITWGFGLDKQGVNATQAARARCCLRAVSGNLDIRGGEPLGWNEPVGRIIGDEELELNTALSTGQRAKQLGAEIILLARLNSDIVRPIRCKGASP